MRPPAPPRYQYVARLVAEPASQRKMVALVREFAESTRAGGQVTNVLRPIAGSPGLTVGMPFASLSALEEFRAKQQNDDGYWGFVDGLLPMLAEPVRFHIREVIVVRSP